MTVGFLAVDKPRGITSHDVVDRVRRATGIRKVGHTGTLDPMATGVVVVAVGPATRLIRFLADLDKEYVATACFGVVTDSLDADGQVIDDRPMSVTREDLEALRPQFSGEIQQVPPMVSALQKDGRRLYDLARQGVEVEREARTVVIHQLEFLDIEPAKHPLVSFRVVCGKGTYVRSLADDMARALGGIGGHLRALRRTRNGVFGEERAVALDDLEGWRDHLLDPAEALAFMPAVRVDEGGARRVGNGRPLEESTSPGMLRVLGESGSLLAVYRSDGEVARPEVVLG
ncbi:MAG: tRNA pseudouridine(55) synthase TruB [Acidimicrobiia bacterium]